MSTPFDVRDYGAKGDGSADDTRAIQLAINAASQAGGGEVWMPPGTYRVSGPNADGACITLKSHVALIGSGQGETVLKLADGSSADIDGIVRASALHNTLDASVQNFTIDGNQNHTSGTVHGLVTGSDSNPGAHTIDFAVQGVALANCSGDGLLANPLSIRLTVSDSLAADNGNDGFSTRFQTESNLAKGDSVQFLDNEAARNGGDGIDFQYAGYSNTFNLSSHDNTGNGAVIERLPTDAAFKGDGTVWYADVHGNGGAGVVVRSFTPYFLQVAAHDNGGPGFSFEGTSDAFVLQSELTNNQQAAAAGAKAAELSIQGYVDADGILHRPVGRLDIENSSIVGSGNVTVGIAIEDSLSTVPHTVSGTLLSGFDIPATGLDSVQLNIDAINRLYGTAVADVLDVPLGAMALFGEGGADALVGGDFADRLVGGAGGDTLTGGAGADTFVFNRASDSNGAGSNATFDTITDLATGADQLDLTALGLTGVGNGLNGTVALSYSAAADVTYLRSLATAGPSKGFELALAGDYRGDLTSADFVSLYQGTGSAETLDASASSTNSALRGEGGDDALLSGERDDYLMGGTGADSLTGGGGKDVFVYEQVTDSYVNDRTGAASMDVIHDLAPYPWSGVAGIDHIDLTALGFSGLGDGHNGTLVLSDGADGGLLLQSLDADANGFRFAVQLNNDTGFVQSGHNLTEALYFPPGPILPTPTSPVAGSDEHDWLIDAWDHVELLGKGGDDELWADGGNDTLDGGLGRDELRGGSGADTFRFTATADSIRGDNDVVTDFLALKDTIDVSGLGYTGIDDGTGATVKVVYNSDLDRTYIKNFDTDTHGERFEITLLGNLEGQLDADNFIFTGQV